MWGKSWWISFWSTHLLSEDLVDHFELEDDEAAEILDDSDTYASQYTVHKDGYYKLKKDNDRKQLELNFEKGINNKPLVDPKGIERSIG